MTVWNCSGNASIHNNGLYNNTDIDLVVGGGDGTPCSVTNNDISNTIVHAFGGLQLGVFSPGNGNHSGITYSGNTISSALNLLSFGVMVGLHPWDSRQNLLGAGSVTSNQASGAVINLQIDADSSGMARGTVTGNPVSNAQGSYGFGTCTVSANYAVYGLHAGAISYDPGALSLKFDDHQCTVQ